MPKRKAKEDVPSTAAASAKPTKPKTAPKQAATHPIDLVVVAADATAVAVVGEFNDWNVEKHPLRQREDGSWHITLNLAPGKYQYKFVIDGTRWEDDADNPNRMLNEFGTSNSVMEVV